MPSMRLYRVMIRQAIIFSIRVMKVIIVDFHTMMKSHWGEARKRPPMNVMTLDSSSLPILEVFIHEEKGSS